MANLIIKSSADNLVLQGSDASPAITVGATGTTTFAENATFSGTANNLGTVTAGAINGGSIGSAVTGFAGIKHASVWRLTTSKSHTGEEAITANLEEMDTDNFSKIGSSMTESGGVFTFPETGIWWISFDAYLRATTSAVAYGEIYIDVTVNNSTTYTRSAVSITSGYATNAYMGAFTSTMFDVTDTSTHKVWFKTAFPASSQVNGTTSQNNTSMTFIRLGDT